MICQTACHADVPCWSGGCVPNPREGGISNLIFFSCDWQFSGNVTIDSVVTPIGAITDVANWVIGYTAGFISLSPIGLGSKPAPSPTVQGLTACNPPTVIAETHQVIFKSHDFDDTLFTDRTFWNDISLNYQSYRFGWYGCDGFFYGQNATTDPGFAFSLAVPPAHVKGETFNVPDGYEMTLEFNYRGIPLPQSITNFLTAFDGDCPS